MKKHIALALPLMALIFALGTTNGYAQISNTGPGSSNTIDITNDCDVDIENDTDIDIDIDNDQDAGSGDASNGGNTSGGGATSGDAGNNSGVSVDIDIDNQSGDDCDPCDDCGGDDAGDPTIPDEPEEDTDEGEVAGTQTPSGLGGAGVASLPDTNGEVALYALATGSAVLVAVAASVRGFAYIRTRE